MNVEIGQEVAIVGSTKKSIGWIVSRITKAGQIEVERGAVKRRFSKRGFEIGGGGGFDSPQIHLDVEKVRSQIAVGNTAKNFKAILVQIKSTLEDASRQNYDEAETSLAKIDELLPQARTALAQAREAKAIYGE